MSRITKTKVIIPFERQLGGVPTAVFRVEAGTLRAYRAGNVNARLGLVLALRYLLKNPGRRVYSLDSRWDVQTPAKVQSVMEELAAEFGLVKVVPVTAATLLGMIRTLGVRKLRQWVLAALSRVRRLPMDTRLSRSAARLLSQPRGAVPAREASLAKAA
jgi:hypothetical protein